tara:strand:- start:5506 stop:7206 length:1701 start_codon:yes stop_codon:yes gene_type:complete
MNDKSKVDSISSEFKIAFDFHTKNERDKAERSYKNILKIDPNHFDTLRHLGILYQDKEMYDKAEKYYLKAYKINSNHFSIYNNLGTIKFLQFKLDDALKFYKQAFKMNPKFVPVINNISTFYHRNVREEECLKFAKLALSIEPNNLVSKSNYAKALTISNELTEAIKIFKEVLAINPDANNYKDLGTAYRNMGELEQSYDCFLKALECNPTDIGAFFNLSASKIDKPDEKKLIKFEKFLKMSDHYILNDKGGLAFALYNSYHKIKNYEKASKFLIIANKHLDRWISSNIDDEEKFIDGIKSIYTKEFIKKNIPSNASENNNKPKPIFILGMPRSGTSLCEQILASHSEVSGGGELQYLVDISEIGNTVNTNLETLNLYRNKINSIDAHTLKNKSEEYIDKLKKISAQHKFVTDKMPHNFILIGFIKILFPNAKIIYCKRDPMDNCFSLFTHKFVDKSHGYCYNQKTLGKYYNLHMKLMNYWLKIFKDEIYVLNHENLVEDQEKYSKEIIKYCELEWEPGCLEFYKTKRQVKTASNEQVREPINKNSIAAWKKYEDLLGPLKKSLNL